MSNEESLGNEAVIWASMAQDSNKVLDNVSVKQFRKIVESGLKYLTSLFDKNIETNCSKAL